MHPQYTTKIVARFWPKVDKSGDCWLWTACKTRTGYGRFQMNERARLAHRVSYELTYGAIPDGLLVCHHCDTPACVRPDHLFLGTSKDNKQDSVKKGRTETGDRHWTHRTPGKLARGAQSGPYTKPESFPRGEQHHKAKLTESNVREIRRRRASGEKVHSIAVDFGITDTSVSFIVLRRTWQHIE